MNTWIGIGNLTADPKTRKSQSGTDICRFQIAVNDKDEANFITIVTFGKQAESCGRYLRKGSKVAVNGRIKTGSYVNNEGQKVYTTEINAQTVEFLTPKQTEQGTYQSQEQAYQNEFNGYQTGFGDEGVGSFG